jgi:hypothetical protein
MCVELSDLSELGSGYPMFFDFIKFCIFILFMFIISSGSYNAFSNYLMGKSCKDLTSVQDPQK